MIGDLDYEPPVPRRRKRRFNPLIAAVVIACGSLAWLGLDRVSTTNAIASVGRQERALEKEIAELELASNNADLDISEALSRPDVKERLMASRTRLRKIKPSDIVYLDGGRPLKSSETDHRP